MQMLTFKLEQVSLFLTACDSGEQRKELKKQKNKQPMACFSEGEKKQLPLIHLGWVSSHFSNYTDTYIDKSWWKTFKLVLQHPQVGLSHVHELKHRWIAKRKGTFSLTCSRALWSMNSCCFLKFASMDFDSRKPMVGVSGHLRTQNTHNHTAATTTRGTVPHTWI